MIAKSKNLFTAALLTLALRPPLLSAAENSHVELSRSEAMEERLHRQVGKSIADQILSHMKDKHEAILRGEEPPKLSVNLLRMIALEAQRGLEKGSGKQLSLESIVEGDILKIQTLSLSKDLEMTPLSMVLDPNQIESTLEKNPRTGATEIVLKLPNRGDSSSLFLGFDLFGKSGPGPIKKGQIEYLELSRLALSNPSNTSSRSLVYEKSSADGEPKLSILEDHHP